MTAILRLVLVVALAAAAATACRRELRELPDLRSDEAAAALKAEPAFTTRRTSAIGRELLQVVAVRRIGRGSTEVEFTWRDAAPASNASAAPARTSMALFRVQEDGRWRLSSLFKLD